MSELVSVPFYGDTLWAIEENGEVLAAIRPIVEALGLSWSRQRKQVMESALFGPAVALRTSRGADGKQHEMVCLPIEMLHGWLFKISAERAAPAIRERLLRYQLECCELIDRHLRPHRRTSGSPAEALARHRRIEASLHHHQLRMLALIKAYGQESLGEVNQRMEIGAEGCRRTLELLIELGAVELGWRVGIRTARYIEPEARSASLAGPRPPSINGRGNVVVLR